MKAFHFTLEAVRTVRRQIEQSAMEGYAAALLARQQAFERLDGVQRQLNAGWQDLRSQLARGCTAAQAAQAQDYHRSLEKLRDELSVALGVMERRVNAALQAMLGARQQREIVDKSFEKQKAGHERGLLQAEQKVMDDLAGRRPGSLLSWTTSQTPT